MQYLAIIDAGSSQTSLKVFEWTDTKSGSITSRVSAIFEDDDGLVVEGGLHDWYDAENDIGIATRLAPIIHHLEVTLKAQTPAVKSGSVSLFLAGTAGLRGSRKAREILEQGYATMKAFGYFNVGALDSSATILSEENQTYCANLSVHRDVSLAGELPVAIFAPGTTNVEIVPSEESDNMCLRVKYDDWQSTLAGLSLLGSSSWVTGVAVCIIENKWPIDGTTKSVLAPPPLDFVVSGSMQLKHSHPPIKPSTPSWAAPLFHHLTHHRKNETSQKKIEDFIASRTLVPPTKEVTKGPTEKESSETRTPAEPSLNDETLNLSVVKAITEILDETFLDSYVVVGGFAMSLLGSKRPVDKVDIIFKFNKDPSFIAQVEDALSQTKKYEVESKEVAVEIHIMLTEKLIEILPNGPDAFGSVREKGVPTMYPFQLLVVTLVRWVMAYTFVHHCRPNSLLWKKFEDETEDILFLLDYILAEREPAFLPGINLLLGCSSYPICLLQDSYEYIHSSTAQFGMPVAALRNDLPDEFLVHVVALFLQFHLESEQGGGAVRRLPGQLRVLLIPAEFQMVEMVYMEPTLTDTIFAAMFDVDGSTREGTLRGG
ncbi:hypothetical protein DXG01_009778 [Tephrocybe rancida]|nr:hypothetical protein DXG01_009778 [Tephrocybe rancida]